MIVRAGAYLVSLEPKKRVDVFLNVPEKQAIFQVIPPESS
jgi:hypothetical protein